MPVERRTFTAAKPVKTERTHEENQERAYIAASRRSDRSLEARIESARRASEIHKKRTGRALRVTEQDVINEEMYEEEDDDLPTQYQRLNAHLHTTSVLFNKKLHDYIATQHGVRNMFMSQYQNPPMPQFAGQFSPSTTTFPQSTANNWLNPSMPPPHQFNAASSQQSVSQPPPPPSYASNNQQQHGFRHTPYQIPQRTNPHQRSLSIQLPNATSVFEPATQSATGSVTSPQESFNRRLSLPPSAFNQTTQSIIETQTRPSLSRSSTGPSVHPSTPSNSGSSINGGSDEVKSPLQNDANTTISFPFGPTGYSFDSQVLNSNILSMSLPPESQQFVGSALDPNDPRTAVFMAGSDNLPQPFAPTYNYNPNATGKPALTGGIEAATQASVASVKTEPTDVPPSTMPTSLSDSFFSSDAFLTPGNADYNAFFDFQGAELAQAGEDQGDGSNFVNWD